MGKAIWASVTIADVTHALPFAAAKSTIVAATVSVAIGLTFGLYPALRAARLSPIDAFDHQPILS